MAKRQPGERDFRDMRRAGDPEPKTLPDQRQRRWWDLEGKECAQSIESTVQTLQKAQQPRLRQAALSMRLYGNFSVFGAAMAPYARAMLSMNAVKDRMTDNVIQSVVDTIHSKVMEGKPRPYFLTSGGNYRQQRKAKKLNQFEEGNFYQNKTYEVGGLATRDACIWGDGFVHVFPRGGKIRHERVLGAELWVDEEEAQYGFPRNMWRVKDVDRDELAGYFPDSREEIFRASKTTDKASAGQSISDMVKVVEAWHLGAMNAKGDLKGGKHCIALVSDSTMLVEPEDWPHDFFPFARMSWCPRPTGYWSQGLCEQLQGDQLELNKELFHIQRSLHLAGSIKVFLKNGSKIVKETINNEIGGIVNYTGEKPEYVVPAPIHPIYLENPQRIRERMYSRAGISEMSAGGKKPMGLDSGRALREQQDIESDRFKTTQRQLDAFYMQISALDVAIAMEMDSVDPVRVPGRGGFENLDLKADVGSLKDSEFVLRCYSTSSLPKEPSAKLQTVTEYMQAGIYSLRQGRKLLDTPDLEAAEALGNAQENLLTKVLEDIAYEDEYAPPEPTDDLKLAKEMIIEFIQYMRLNGLEESKLNQLRNWNTQLDALVEKTMVQPAPVNPAMGAAPQAAPEAPPTSAMLPNAPQQAA